MKKTLTILAILLGMTLSVTAQNGGGLFQRGMVSDEAYYGNGNDRSGTGLILPNAHGTNTDANASPLGSGIAVLLGLGGAYLVAKKRKEE